MRILRLILCLLVAVPLFAAEIAPEATVGQAYSYKVAFVKDPAASCMLRPEGSPGVINGLPAGMNFTQPATISGTPTRAGTYEFSLECTAGAKEYSGVVRIKVVQQ